ncbi:MAG: GDSL-type esterase/lipase family protein [Mucinivorans sp.]
MKRFFSFLLVAIASCVMALGAAPIKVACVGNSVTYGYLVENREVNAYPAVLQRMLGAAYQVENFGRSGATLLNNGHNPYIKTAEYRRAVDFKADVVVIHLGLNDTDPRNYPRYREQFIPNYLALIDTFRMANPKARIIVAQMSPIFHNHWRFKAGTHDWYQLIQKDIATVAQMAGLETFSFQDLLYMHPNLFPDAIHPNVQGAKMMAGRVFSAITGDFGGLKLGDLYADNMVLQRSDATTIEGKANAGKKVNITLDNQKYSTVTDANGHWKITPALRNAKNNLTLKISSENVTKTYKNVAIGELWILSGQSNMSFPVQWSTNPQNARENPNIRLYMMEPMFAEQDSLSAEKLAEINSLSYARDATWRVATTDEIKPFSGIGYYFGQMLADSLKGVTIGLVQTSLGGAPAESFVERSLLENNADVIDILYNWKTNQMIDDWVRSVMARSLMGTKDPLQRHYFEPTYLYEARIAPLAGTTVRGVLWYQGESNADNAELHSRLFPLVVQSFRTAFNSPNLPFYFVQLADCDRPSWPHFRDTQRQLAEQIDNCEMVVSMDYGDPNDVHPKRKQPVGERLARVALEKLYGF